MWVPVPPCSAPPQPVRQGVLPQAGKPRPGAGRRGAQDTPGPRAQVRLLPEPASPTVPCRPRRRGEFVSPWRVPLAPAAPVQLFLAGLFRCLLASPHPSLARGCCRAGFVSDPVSLAGKWRAVCRASRNSPRLPANDGRARLCAVGCGLQDDSVPRTPAAPASYPPLQLLCPQSPQPGPPGTPRVRQEAANFRVPSGTGSAQPWPQNPGSSFPPCDRLAHDLGQGPVLLLAPVFQPATGESASAYVLALFWGQWCHTGRGKAGGNIAESPLLPRLF